MTSTLFFDTNFKIHKCSTISKLKSTQFNNSHLRSLFLKVLIAISNEAISSSSSSIIIPSASSKYLVSKNKKSSIFDSSLATDDHRNEESINWQYIKNNTKIIFKQERSSSIFVSYVIVSFPKEVHIKKQKFIFIQRIDENEKSKEGGLNNQSEISLSCNFNTIILLSTSQNKFSSVFLKYCSTYLINTTPILIVPISFNNLFFHKSLNMLYNGIVKIEDMGILNIAFKPKTTSNALSEIRINITGTDLQQYLITNKKYKDTDNISDKNCDKPLDLIFKQLHKHTALDLYNIAITKFRVSECISFSDSNRVQFFGTPNRLPVIHSRDTDNENPSLRNRTRNSNGDKNQNHNKRTTIVDIMILLL